MTCFELLSGRFTEFYTNASTVVPRLFLPSWMEKAWIQDYYSIPEPITIMMPGAYRVCLSVVEFYNTQSRIQWNLLIRNIFV